MKLFCRYSAQRIYHKKVRDLSTRPPRQTNLVATRVSSFSLATPLATTSGLGYAASATEGASLPLLSDPHATTSTSSKGVAVGSLYQGGANSSRGTGASYKTVRLSGVSSRHAVKGGEVALVGGNTPPSSQARAPRCHRHR